MITLNLPKDFFIKEYVIQKKSISRLSKELNCSVYDVKAL